MSKKIRLEDLPKWFDLAKYQGTKDFSAAEWFACLSVRKGIIGFFKFLKTPYAIAGFFEHSEASLHEYEILHERPLDFGAGNGWLWFGSEVQANKLNKPVSDLMFQDLVFQFQSDQDAVTRGAKESIWSERWRLIATPEELYMPTCLNNLAVGHLEDAGNAVLVDLRATDSVLIKAFSDWLQIARLKSPPSISKRERPAYKDWSRYGLLPYLDLVIWENEMGVRISHHVMAEAIGYRKGGDSFRKTVPKLANDLMRSLSELEALAAIEASPE